MKFQDAIPAGARAFETRVQVQWGDVDIAGIMYFAAYWRVAERAEMNMLAELGFQYVDLFERYGIWLPRVHAEADYHAPALMDDWLRARTHVERVGASSVCWRTVVFNERTGEAGANLSMTVACMDAASKRGAPLPADLRAALLACVGDS